MFGLHQSSQRADGVLKIGSLTGLLTDNASGYLNILIPDGIDHVAGGQIPRSDLLGIQPQAHAVVAGAEHHNIAHARQARQGILDL